MAEASLTASTTNAIQLKDIDRAVAKAKTASPMIRPIKHKGEDYYLLFMHPYSMYQMRTDTTTNNYVDIFKSALQGGKYSDNPIFTGASFVYNNVIVHESTRIPTIVGTPATGAATDFRSNVFCGAQSGIFAFGRDNGPDRMNWSEELFDYENQLGVAAGCIAGFKKTVYNSSDFSTIVLSGYAPAQ